MRRFSRHSRRVALYYARVDQTLQCVLHHLDRVSETLDRKNHSLTKYFFGRVVGIALRRRKTNKIDPDDRAAHGDFVYAVRIDLNVHGILL
ncbi:MAG: hypothetical protein BGP05_00940 [Rhizobiales bacterium 62-47]|nr:MAG: hypothetical protein BGP05_00940 [Rhizobiales bacterium 62-47]